MAVIAPWFRLRLPSCGPGYESQAHHLRFFQCVLLKLYWDTNENKQKNQAKVCRWFKLKQSRLIQAYQTTRDQIFVKLKWRNSSKRIVQKIPPHPPLPHYFLHLTLLSKDTISLWIRFENFICLLCKNLWLAKKLEWRFVCLRKKHKIRGLKIRRCTSYTCSSIGKSGVTSVNRYLAR